MKGKIEMRVKSKKVQVRMYTEMTVTSDTNGKIVFHGRMDNGETWCKALEPKDAVQVWRRMMGEMEDAMIVKSPYLELKYDDHEQTWMFMDENVLCVLDMDECMLVAWAIEKAGGIALYNGPVTPVQAPAQRQMKDVFKIWMLVSSSVRNHGDPKVEMTKGMTVNAKAFETREAALDGLREFLREEVNCTHSEAHFEDLQDHGRDVDDILDDILEEGNFDEKGGFWKYDGTERSFFVKLIPTDINKEQK